MKSHTPHLRKSHSSEIIQMGFASEQVFAFSEVLRIPDYLVSVRQLRSYKRAFMLHSHSLSSALPNRLGDGSQTP